MFEEAGSPQNPQEQAPVQAEPQQPAAPAAEGQTPEPDLPPNMQEAFSKRLGAALSRQEQQLRAQLEMEYQQRLMQQAPLPEPPPGIPPEDQDEEYQRVKEEILNSWYDDPIKATERLESYRQQRAQQRTQAEQAQWNYHATLLSRRYQDWAQMAPVMQQVLRAQPDLAEKPEHLERVYMVAKLYQQASTPQLDALLQNQQFGQQLTARMLQDQNYRQMLREQLRSEIVQEYVTGKKQQAQQAPMLMGNNPGGSSPAMPPSTPRSWDDAKRAALARLGGGV